jgi:hypothetical protein
LGIRPTSDGGFVAVGSVYDPSQNTARLSAVILKLDSQGNVQWLRTLGQAGGPLNAYFNAVQPADGSYVAAGEFSPPSTCDSGHGCDQGVLVVKLDANGSVAWQRGFNSFDSSGKPTAGEHVFSITQASDGGGFVVSGRWGNSPTRGACCPGPLLLKLDANGNIQWQRAYEGGVYCVSSYWFCHPIGGLAYSVHQTSDGGYSLAGAGDLTGGDSVAQVPWLARSTRAATFSGSTSTTSPPRPSTSPRRPERRLSGARVHGEPHRIPGRALRRQDRQLRTRRHLQSGP